ncbi:hypothetical protein SDC9_144198 [bioreactor metagenome]|uniref:Uncharacterized protein n=1 Tax=bioreactor metagenome TaxID=1076179 RepID=A0A645E5J7_9ZZZZ
MFSEITSASTSSGIRYNAAPAESDDFAGKMFGKKTDNVMVKDDCLVDNFAEFAGKHTNRGTAAAHPHFCIFDTVNNRSITDLKF